jgi:hypothetical protein
VSWAAPRQATRGLSRWNYPGPGLSSKNIGKTETSINHRFISTLLAKARKLTVTIPDNLLIPADLETRTITCSRVFSRSVKQDGHTQKYLYALVRQPRRPLREKKKEGVMRNRKGETKGTRIDNHTKGPEGNSLTTVEVPQHTIMSDGLQNTRELQNAIL